MGRYVIDALSALSAFDRSGRSHDQEADGEGNGGKHNRNQEEVVGKRVHKDLQSAARQGNDYATVALDQSQEMPRI